MIVCSQGFALEALVETEPLSRGVEPAQMQQEGFAAAPATIFDAPFSTGRIASKSVVVAIIDTGVISGHPSLQGALLPGHAMQGSRPHSSQLEGAAQPSADPDPLEHSAQPGSRCASKPWTQSQRTHGTEIASIIAGNGQAQVFGINPEAKVLPIKVYGACGIQPSNLMNAMRWAAGVHIPGYPPNLNPARILNISISAKGSARRCGRAMQETVTELSNMGVFVVVAAGNTHLQEVVEPANCEGVIAVGSLDGAGKVASYSAMDQRITVYAPGGGGLVNSGERVPGHKIRVASYERDMLGNERPVVKDLAPGTSFSAPFVSALISLWLRESPHKTPRDFLQELPNFTRRLGGHARCADCSALALEPSWLMAWAR